MTALRTLLLLTIAVASACSGAPAGGTTAAATLTVTMTDNKIVLDPASVPSGTVNLVVKNTGTVVHSLVVLRTDLADDKIPADPQDASKVSETGLVKATGQIAAGQTKQVAAKLEPGKYVLVCNEPGHYLIGMHAPLVVR